jgi:hypothetical protein
MFGLMSDTNLALVLAHDRAARLSRPRQARGIRWTRPRRRPDGGFKAWVERGHPVAHPIGP